MRYVNYATYVDDPTVVTQVRPTHRRYTAQLTAAGKLVAGGPFADGSGGLFIYEVASLEEAQAIVAADPYQTEGAFAHTELKAWEVVTPEPTS